MWHNFNEQIEHVSNSFRNNYVTIKIEANASHLFKMKKIFYYLQKISLPAKLLDFYTQAKMRDK